MYLSLDLKDKSKPKMYILSPNHDVASYLTQTNNLGTTFYAIFMPSRSRSNCIFGLWVKSKILGSSHFALSESDLNALHFLEYNWFEGQKKWMKKEKLLQFMFNFHSNYIIELQKNFQTQQELWCVSKFWWFSTAFFLTRATFGYKVSRH